MSTIDAAQEQEVAFLTGVSAQGTVATQSYWTWDRDDPASYASTSSEAKWGAPIAGTGATVTVAFDPASHWTGTETAAFQASLDLWSEVANIRFDVVGGASADLVITRAHDGSAETSASRFDTGAEGSTDLGTIARAHISIDTSVGGFGPIGAGFATDGGYPWMTMAHEIGHAIGLGHAGPYNDDGDGDAGTATPMLTGYDSLGWSIMSYHSPDDLDDPGSFIGNFHWENTSDGSYRVPLTPMPLDIAAAERLYGMPVDTPLSGGQTFGFHSNIQGDTAQFFDFTIDTAPVVTLWDAGGNNTLDLSGYATSNIVSLTDGTSSNVGGLVGNVSIAYGTHIDTAIGGTGQDTIVANEDGDVIEGDAGADTLTGGGGNDHIYGNLAAGVQGASDGDDVIDTGGGTNYVNGNAGDDHITASGDANRIYGGAGDDLIIVNGVGVNHVNGNAGADHIYIWASGSNYINGGQDNDYIQAFAGNNVFSGDKGDDTLVSGPGVDVLTGGDGHDMFEFDEMTAPLTRSGALAGYHDEITDFTSGTDTIHLQGNHAAPTVLHAGDGLQLADVDAAAAYAQTQLSSAANGAVAALQVGSDAFLFYDAAGNGPAVDSAIKLDGIVATQIQSSDFGA